YEDIVERAGPGALVFATPVSNREILVDWFAADAAGQEVPVAWAVDRIRVQGRFSADSLEQDVALIPANRSLNRYDPVSAADTHYWLIPGTAVEALANDPTTRLTLDFDLGLLDPDAYRLPTDGQRHEIPELGSCRAETDLNANQIEIDCVKNGTQPALVAAQLIGIDSSRVYSRFRPTYKADWLETLSRKHYRMTIDSPTLTDSSAIMLTAFNARRIVHRQLVTQGLFGDLPAVCPLQESEKHDAIEQSTWSDKSPHEISSVAVEQGVRLEVLDWRQHNPADAPTLVLLHGLGATAHSFDELAPRLAEKYNVVAITRRGVGGSSAPDHGYDIARLSQDVLQVLATLQIEQPVLVGHSIAGEELSYLGARFPERFAGLVYLDAAYDRTAGFSHHYRELSVSLPEAPPIRPAETRSYAAFLDYSRRLGRARTIPEGEILASYDLVSGSIRHNPLYLDAVMMGLQAPDYRHITIPALGIYAVPVSPEALMEPWYDQDDPEVKAAVTELYTMERQQKLAQMARFDSEIPDSKALALDNANHWIFVSHETEVLAAIDRFMSGLMP
ncbi:MAG: alpha/beta hydrolase, partial [Pseudomonadales bacterium]|nr:alpha/beta hydrolase [Pseudomonadales bacterium]